MGMLLQESQRDTNPTKGSVGNTGNNKKKIYYHNIKNILVLLLIHEMAHAVAPGGHYKKWQNRMRKAADKAIEMGYNEQSFDGLPNCLWREADYWENFIKTKCQSKRKCSMCGHQWTAKTNNSRCPKCRSKESERLEA